MPCELGVAEHALDRIEAALAAELPLHVRAFAHAYAAGSMLPPAPALLRQPRTLGAARDAFAHPFLADRALALLRLAAPLAIEADSRVVAVRARVPTWDALTQLVAMRDSAAVALFGWRAIDVVHRLDGVGDIGGARERRGGDGRRGVERGDGDERDGSERGRASARMPAVVAGWSEPDGRAIGGEHIEAVWAAMHARAGGAGHVQIVRARSARPRTFVVEARREVIVVVPEAIDTPAARFAVLHELGHAFAALAGEAGIPRVLDEAVAARAARAIEELDHPWYSPLARAARARRVRLAEALDRIERNLPALDERPTERPPWALWHDAGAQAAYVGAEALADEIELAPESIAMHRARIDRATSS